MQPSEDYPRMMFHRTKEAVVVLSREEEDALGKEWSRIIWQASAIAEPEPAPAPELPKPQAAGYAAAVPEPGGPAGQVEALRPTVRARQETAPAAPIRPARALPKSPAKAAQKRRPNK
jgi:hypothetical protein